MAERAEAPAGNRWIQLAAGLICMTMIANLQYGWTLFVNPIDQKFHWGTAAIQVAFATFVLTETWLVPIEGWFVDRYGPRWVVAAGGVLVAGAWALDSVAASLPVLYLAAVLSGIGAAGVYGTCVANALKWYPEHRGLCAGITAAGFGAGAALTVWPISAAIDAFGYQAAFLWAGLGQGAVILVLSQFLRAPAPGQHFGQAKRPARRLRQTQVSLTPFAMIRQPTFYVLFAMFLGVAAPGLVVTAQLAPIARDFQIAGLPVDLVFVSSTVLTTALFVDNILNGLARPFFGWVSDHLGRENTMAMVFTGGAVSYLCLSAFGHDPIAFILSAGMIFFTWGEIYSLFPALCADLYGPKYAATNAGLLYTAKGAAATMVPLASIFAAANGWTAVFVFAAIVNVAVAATALFILKPMRSARLPVPQAAE